MSHIVSDILKMILLKHYTKWCLSCFVAPPTLELFLSPGSSSTKLVCVGSGFNPQLKWKHTTKLKLNENRKVLLENDGRLTVTIEMDVPQKEWHKGMNFPCEVEDQDQNVKNKETRDISICSGNAPSFQALSVGSLLSCTSCSSPCSLLMCVMIW